MWKMTKSHHKATASQTNGITRARASAAHRRGPGNIQASLRRRPTKGEDAFQGGEVHGWVHPLSTHFFTHPPAEAEAKADPYPPGMLNEWKRPSPQSWTEAMKLRRPGGPDEKKPR